MWKEVTARTHADHACDNPTRQKQTPLRPLCDKQRSQASGSSNPHDHLRPSEKSERVLAEPKPHRRFYGTDVFQIMSEDIVDEVLQTMSEPEVQGDKPQHSYHAHGRPNDECERAAPSLFSCNKDRVETNKKKPINCCDLLESDGNRCQRAR